MTSRSVRPESATVVRHWKQKPPSRRARTTTKSARSRTGERARVCRRHRPLVWAPRTPICATRPLRVLSEARIRTRPALSAMPSLFSYLFHARVLYIQSTPGHIFPQRSGQHVASSASCREQRKMKKKKRAFEACATEFPCQRSERAHVFSSSPRTRLPPAVISGTDVRTHDH